MEWTERLTAELDQDRATLQMGGDGDALFAPFVAHQTEQFGLSGEQMRLPEHFRGAWEQAKVCFIGPHVMLVPDEPAPTVSTAVDDYVRYYGERPGKRDPFGHYSAITDGAPWVATELIHWPCQKEFGLKLLKGAAGPTMITAALDVTWAMLRASAVEVVVLTGNDALKWVLPRLGWSGGALPGVTQLHAQRMGRFPLPGAPGREITVVASFHWSKEMPLFVRKVAGLSDLPVGKAISEARQMVGRAISQG